MELFPKRQRIYSPIGPLFPQSFDSEDVYYDDEDDFIVDEEEGEEDVEETPPDLDPESDFQQKRARLDYKLKSTFEAIFEKYGRNFDGIGDEIDLATGEIVVNNGHILEMLDERDAGDVDGTQSVPTEATEESGDPPSSIIEISDSDEDEEDEASDDVSDEEVLEDDLILRGFAQANRFSQPSPELSSLRNPARPIRPPTSHPQPSRQSTKTSTPRLPSQAEILTQFGPQLGPQIVEYVSKQSAPKINAGESAWSAPEIPAFRQRDNAIEPAWRAPEIPAFKPRRLEFKEPVLLPPQPERSPSPQEATSIWALPRKRGPNKKPAGNSIAHMVGGSSGARYREKRPLDPAGFSARMEVDRQASPVIKKRRKFTDEDDQILLSFVTQAKQQGVLLNNSSWRKLEAKHPNHSWSSWEYRYKHHLTYLVSNSTEDSEVSVDDPSADSVFVGPGTSPAQHPNLMSQTFNQQTSRVWPNRIRKPAQKDSRIISWSEAVDALESLDPEIHAGLLDDAGMTETSNPNSSYTHKNVSKQLPRAENIPQPTKYQPTPHPPKSPIREIIDLTEDVSDPRVVPNQERHSIPGAPCPHADCRAYPTATYRLQRRDNEELSEMCLHLFRVHHTTPYPCGEIICPRQFEEGFFMQADLVRHVRKAHPTIGALHRLRGRVDSELLKRNIELATPADPDHQLNRPVSQLRDSDFMSPRKFHDTRPISSQQYSSSDLDRTPRASTTIPGMSRSTPMTSVSSMRVHHPSTIKASVEEEVEDDNLRYIKYIDDMSMRAQRSSRGVIGGLGLDNSQPPAPKVSSSLKGKENASGSGPSNSVPTPMTATGSFSDSGYSFVDDNSRQQRPPLKSHQQSATVQVPPELHSPAFAIAETPEPAPKQVQEKAQMILPTSSPMQIGHKPTPSDVPRNIQRNFLDPAYEFSDEDLEPNRANKATHIQPPSNTALLKLSQEKVAPERVITARNTQHLSSTAIPNPSLGISSMGPPPAVNISRTDRTSVKPRSKRLKRVTKPGAGLTFNTPSAQRAVRQSILRMALDTDGFDELSLDKDDVVLLSSQPRLKPLSSREITIKQEDVMNTPRPLPSTISKKRDFSTFRRANSPDELATEEVSPSARIANTSQAQPEIKLEEDMTLPALPRPVAKKPGVVHKSKMPSQMTPSSISRQLVIRNSTPLLNLTPVRPMQPSNEILDSTAEESSPTLPTHPPQRPRNNRQREAPTSTSSSPLANLLTPTKKPMEKPDFLKAEQVTVVVKTPGGTYRRCGEDGFACGRSFCFRCGSGSGSGSGTRVGV